MKKVHIVVSVLIFMVFVFSADAQDLDSKKTPGPSFVGDMRQDVPGESPVIKMIKPGVFEIGSVRLDKEMGIVEFDAVINMNKGLLEYLLVGKSGKLHESLLRTDVEPFDLQIALLMIGLEGTMNPLAGQGDTRIPSGDPVKIILKINKNGKIKDLPVESLIYTKGKDKKIESIDWVFTGSIVENGIFMAQAEKSIVALYHDPIAMFDNKSTEGASDEVWSVNSLTVPPVGTKVTVTIKAISN